MSDSNQNTYVATVNVRDDFFNDPFFKDWWSDFENPISVIDNTESGLHSIISETCFFNIFKILILYYFVQLILYRISFNKKFAFTVFKFFRS